MEMLAMRVSPRRQCEAEAVKGVGAVGLAVAAYGFKALDEGGRQDSRPA